jgi:hypothetical protein
MATSWIRMGHVLGQTPPNVYNDFDWIHRNKKELIEKYGECNIIVYKEQVLGVGSSYKEALENAERDLPPNMGEITPVHQWLYRRHPILRVIPTKVDKE